MAEDIESPEGVARRSAKASSKKSRSGIKPVRSLAIFGAVGALVAAVALPAYAATSGASSSKTEASVQQLAEEDAQSLVVASEATAAPMERAKYDATTPKEIEKKKAEEARAAAAKRAAAQNVTLSSADLRLTAPGSGEVRYPLPPGSYNVSRTVGNGHNGADMAGPSGTPIFAATGGTVRISQESYFGYGVAVVIDGVVGGKRVSTTYAHMINGSRGVSAGQHVEPGQFIGKRGNTGHSFGSHLHFEVHINGSLVEPISWLAQNAG